ncbi:MAG: glutathione S-transferase family protein [Comamonadaceae bacterium]|nr:MAG: glutathione S-transferase family protein [Comamonadaceae bacterium]
MTSSTTSAPLLLSGNPGSPYTRKMVALLRYRRISYRLVNSSTGIPGLPQAKPPLLPTFYLPAADGSLQAVTDSTPLIRRFESEFAGRSVIPLDPALAFIDALLEDFGDEWLTKAMFHYRWSYAADIAKARHVLSAQGMPMQDDVQFEKIATYIADRQIPRLRYVGSNPVTAPVIEAGYLRVLKVLEDHFKRHPFVLGKRPGSGDFGLYGQLTQLAHFDPTPMALTVQHAPRVLGWVGLMEDLSGIEPNDADWLDASALPEGVHTLLCEVGRLYVPVMLANARALTAGETEVHAVVDGQPWVQQAFPYQGKCLSWLRRDYQALDANARATVDRALAGTGCEALFAAP